MKHEEILTTPHRGNRSGSVRPSQFFLYHTLVFNSTYQSHFALSANSEKGYALLIVLVKEACCKDIRARTRSESLVLDSPLNLNLNKYAGFNHFTIKILNPMFQMDSDYV